MLDETNAYIKISRFTESTAEEFNEKLNPIKIRGNAKSDPGFEK